MTREITHFQQFEAALSTIQPNFPPGTLQTSPKYSNLYFNLSRVEIPVVLGTKVRARDWKKNGNILMIHCKK